ncbi:MAG: hypothetical protein JSS43_27100 [Proteobacteria bacterium]|nr:hypothetical protein [Pseudomonadota bacterium]
MSAIHRLAPIAACLAGLSLASAAQAQTAPLDDGGKLSFQSGLLMRKAKPTAPDVPAPPQAWPRLEAGAIVCRTESDLDRLAARHNGESAGGPVDCQVLRDVTAITILQRRGPAKQEVQFTSGKVGTVGWTNAWLPEKAPAATRTSTR